MMGNAAAGRLIHASPNGDHWHLLFDANTGRSFVRHTGNAASGGHVTNFDLVTFLATDHRGPEHQELWRLISTLIDNDDSSVPSR